MKIAVDTNIPGVDPISGGELPAEVVMQRGGDQTAEAKAAVRKEVQEKMMAEAARSTKITATFPEVRPLA